MSGLLFLMPIDMGGLYGVEAHGQFIPGDRKGRIVQGIHIESPSLDGYTPLRTSPGEDQRGVRFRGRSGFDGGHETKGACREGSNSRKTITVTFIVANDENYALAA